MEKCSAWCRLADNTSLMTTSSALFSGLFIPPNNSCCEISLIDPICPFEVSTYYVLCGRFNRAEERIFGIKQNKQVCKSKHLSAVKKKTTTKKCFKHFLLFSLLDEPSSALCAMFLLAQLGLLPELTWSLCLKLIIKHGNTQT